MTRNVMNILFPATRPARIPAWTTTHAGLVCCLFSSFFERFLSLTTQVFFSVLLKNQNFQISFRSDLIKNGWSRSHELPLLLYSTAKSLFIPYLFRKKKLEVNSRTSTRNSLFMKAKLKFRNWERLDRKNTTAGFSVTFNLYFENCI